MNGENILNCLCTLAVLKTEIHILLQILIFQIKVLLQTQNSKIYVKCTCIDTIKFRIYLSEYRYNLSLLPFEKLPRPT